MCLKVSGEVTFVGKRLPAVLTRMNRLWNMSLGVLFQLEFGLKCLLTMWAGEPTFAMLSTFMTYQVIFSCQSFVACVTLELSHFVST